MFLKILKVILNEILKNNERVSRLDVGNIIRQQGSK